MHTNVNVLVPGGIPAIPSFSATADSPNDSVMKGSMAPPLIPNLLWSSTDTVKEGQFNHNWLHM